MKGGGILGGSVLLGGKSGGLGRAVDVGGVLNACVEIYDSMGHEGPELHRLRKEEEKHIV